MAPDVDRKERTAKYLPYTAVTTLPSVSLRGSIYPVNDKAKFCCVPCKRQQDKREPLPWRAVVVLALGNNAHFYSICSVFTIAGFLASDLGWVSNKDSAGYVAGWLGSALTLGRIPTAVLHGLASDKYGRRPTLLLTFFWIGVGNIAFGFSRNLYIALALRFIFLGALNGWVSLVGPLVTEIAGPERQNDVNAYVMASGALTQLLGPAAAAILYGKIPRHPALAPALLGFALACLSLFLGFLWLPETLALKNSIAISKSRAYTRISIETQNTSNNDSQEVHSIESALQDVDLENDQPEEEFDSDLHQEDILPLHHNRPFILGVTIRSITGLALFASFDVIPLWAIATKHSGGLAFSRHQLAAVLTVAAFGQFIFNISAMAKVLRSIGNRVGLRLATAFGALGSAMIPLVGRFLLSSANFRDQLLALAPCIMIYYAAGGMSFNAVGAVVNNSVQDFARGKANGVATMFEAIGKAVGPTLGATMFAASIDMRPGPLGAATTFFFIASALAVCSVLTLLLPLIVENPDFRAARERSQISIPQVVTNDIEESRTSKKNNGIISINNPIYTHVVSMDDDQDDLL